MMVRGLIIRIAAAALALALMAGCAGPSMPPDEIPPGPPAAPSGGPDAGQESGAAFAPRTARVTGVLESFGQGRLTVVTEDGQPFDLAAGYGLRGEIGSRVEVEYTAMAAGADVAVRMTVEQGADAVRAASLLAGMTLPEKVAQLFLVHYPGDEAAGAAPYSPGGYLLFAGDFKDKTPDAVRAGLAAVREGAQLPPLFAVDEEGGGVVRVSRFPQFRESPFPAPRSLYAAGGWEGVASDAAEKAELLLSLGMNVNLAPVCDVSDDPSDYIFSRAFGGGARATARFVETAVAAMQSKGLGCVLKHFPGYGGNGDTHTGAAVDYRDFEGYVSSDFLPFEAGIRAGAGAVMLSHQTAAGIDPDAPASMSPQVYRILRETLGFDGVAMTDDLNMKAAGRHGGDGHPAVLAVSAGADMLITPDFEGGMSALLEAVDNRTVDVARIDEAAGRVLLWKVRLGIVG